MVMPIIIKINFLFFSILNTTIAILRNDIIDNIIPVFILNQGKDWYKKLWEKIENSISKRIAALFFVVIFVINYNLQNLIYNF